MAVTLATLSPVTFNGTLSCNAVVQAGLMPGISSLRLAGDGQYAPTKAVIPGQAPRFGFSSYSLDTVLGWNSGNFNHKGIALTSAFNAYQRQLAADGIVGTTGDKIAISNGLVIPVSLEVVDGQPGIVNCIVIGRSADGTTNPLSITADQTSPAGGVGNLFTVGQVERNGTALEGVKRISVDFGIDARVYTGDGQPYPTDIRIVGVAPTIRIETDDADALADFAAGGTAQDATDTEIYLRAFVANGTRAADGASSHIKMVIDDGFMKPADWSAAQGETGLFAVEYEPVWDETADIVVITTGSAIT